MDPKPIYSILVWLALILSACAAPTLEPALPTPRPGRTTWPAKTATAPRATSRAAVVPSPTVTSLAARPTRASIPTPTTVPFPSSTPTQVNGSPTPPIPIALSPDGEAVQCFKGPGMEYEPSEVFKAAEIAGKDETGQWWYLRFFDQRLKPVFCWVDRQKTTQAGDLDNIPVTEAEAASVTTVKITPEGSQTQVITCGQPAAPLEFRFNGEIATSGPLEKLRYQWVTDAGTKFPPELTRVQAWDDPARLTLTVQAPAQEGTYSLTLRTIYPNEMVTVVQFRVKCQ